MKLFDEYRYKRLEIKRLKADKCIVSDSVIASDREAPYAKHKMKITGVDGEKRRLNKARIEKLEAECAYVEAAIALAPNARDRIILELRYLDGLQWAEVSAALAENGIESADATCKQRAYRYFATLEAQQKGRANRHEI